MPGKRIVFGEGFTLHERPCQEAESKKLKYMLQAEQFSLRKLSHLPLTAAPLEVLIMASSSTTTDIVISIPNVETLA